MYGDQVFIVEDRMNKRYWHKVDIWMPTRQEALQFGIRSLEIEILEEA
jgi:3D (Asp-Asp-Asp) domain-containing protein